MIFKEKSPLYAIEVERKQGEEVLYMNFLGAPYVPSISDDPSVMARIIDALAENPEVSRVVFVQQRNYNYSFEQISLLSEMARAYNYLVKQENILSPYKLASFGDASMLFEEMTIFTTLLRQDPFGCYLRLKRAVDSAKSQSKAGVSGRLILLFPEFI